MARKPRRKEQTEPVKANGNSQSTNGQSSTPIISTPKQPSCRVNASRQVQSSGSKIPVFVPKSQSSPNVADLEAELPESVRRKHEQHLAGRHTLVQNNRRNNDNNNRPRHSQTPSRETADVKQRFSEFLPLCELQEALKKGEVVEGILRINPKNSRDSYISASEEGLDILIKSYIERNRALNGDKVAVKFHTSDKWTIHYNILNNKWLEFKDAFQVALAGKSLEQLNIDSLKLNISEHKRVENALKSTNELRAALKIEFPELPPEVLCLSVEELSHVNGWKHFIQRTGFVVGILEFNHSRITGGILEPLKSGAFYKCISSDNKIPDVFIPKSKLPINFANIHNPQQLFLVKIVKWEVRDFFPSGEIFDDLGLRGEIEAEIQIILTSNEVDSSDFPENILDGTGFEAVDWKIPEDELAKRQDFRKHCLFTIDPSTAKDLDDAISLKDLGNGRYEVGVHIADVSYFIREDTLLDDIACRRATSVYLPDRVIPMLPHQFCQNLCSLNPGEDKLAFSTVFVMSEDGNVESHWIGRTVINSCSKLSYENAQKLIDGGRINEADFPKIYNNWNTEDLRKRVITLNNMAKAIRNRRFQTGSVRIDKSKLAFVLDDNQYPIGFAKYIFYDSNRLIEELMLLSNRTVAEHIYNRFSDQGRAFMRRHPPPDQNVLGKFRQYCAILGLGFDTSSSLNIHKSLELVEQKNKELFRWISFQLIRAMKLAQYTTVSRQDSTLFFKHYALNFQYYTHFTSPIRRYADLIVHRLLSEDMSYEGACTKNSEALMCCAVNCNKQKQNAFLVSEDSAKVFMKAHIQKLGRMSTTGIVCEVFEKSLEILLVDFDIPVRVYIDKMPIDNVYYSKENGFPNLKIVWNKAENEPSGFVENLTVTSIVPIELTITEKFELKAVILKPSSSAISSQDAPVSTET